ncbi:MAG: dienelactone hydrolase family protein [Magnetococcales bacterium]|nr:dienelactone hydrolase family protein [Magnetococcales bacterium]
MKKWKLGWLLLAASLWISTAQAELQSREVDYRDGETGLKGYLVWDDAMTGKRPGVLVFHEFWGLNDYAKSRARQLAALGYVAFAADMYGVGHVATHAQEAREWSKQVTSNLEMWQRRATLALAALKETNEADGNRLAAIGYCFGGATVMQLAYTGADVKGVVSFHGSLPAPPPQAGEKIRAKIMVAHGESDPFIPPEKIAAFKSGMNEAKADWQFHSYGGAKHSFTNPDAHLAGNDGAAYNADADRRSWQTMKLFLEEVLSK